MGGGGTATNELGTVEYMNAPLVESIPFGNAAWGVLAKELEPSNVSWRLVVFVICTDAA